MARQALQQREQLRALGCIEGSKEVLLRLSHRALGLNQAALALGGEPDQVAAPVCGVSGADDQAVRLKGVQESDVVTGIDPQCPAELLLGEGTREVEVVQHGELVGSHLQRLERAAKLIAGHTGEPEDQHRVAGGAGRRCLAGSGGWIHCLYSSDI